MHFDAIHVRVVYKKEANDQTGERAWSLASIG